MKPRPTIKRNYPTRPKSVVSPSKPRPKTASPVRPRTDVRPKPLRPRTTKPRPATKPRANPSPRPGSATPGKSVVRPAPLDGAEGSKVKKGEVLKPVGGKRPADIASAATASTQVNKPTVGDRGGFAIDVFSSPGYGTSVSLFAGNINLPTSHGSIPYNYYYGDDPACTYGYGYGYWSNCYNYGQYGYYGYGYGRCYPWYVGSAIYNYAWYNQRWQFGFGFSYSPICYGVGYNYNRYFRRHWYPYYRTYAYYPYCYYDTVSYYPAYSTVYHGSSVVVDYADASDPYVEFTDDVPAAAEAVAPAPVPDAFAKALVTEFPEGLANAELLARGTAWMKDGKYMLSAEAFRRAWIGNSGDAFAPLKLSLALFGAGGRYGLAGFALHESLDRDASSITRYPSLDGDFRDAESLTSALTELKRHVVKNPSDGEARFLLGATLFWSGDSFGARNEFTALKDGEWSSSHVDPFLKTAEERLLDK